MTPPELEAQLVKLLNDAMQNGIHPAFIHTMLCSKAIDCLMLIKQPPQPPPADGGPLIHLPPGR